MKWRKLMFSKIKNLVGRSKTHNIPQSESTEPAHKKIQRSSNAKHRSMRTKTLPHRASPRKTDGMPSRRWWQMLIEISAVIAIPSVVLYVLGVVSFWLRIANEYDGMSLSTTWYAVSLVPRNTAAASGIEVIFKGLVYGTLAASIILFIVHLALYYGRKTGSRIQGIFSSSLLLPIWLFLVGGVAGSFLLLLNENGSYGILWSLRIFSLWFFGTLLMSLVPLIFGERKGETIFEKMMFSHESYVHRITLMIMVAGIFVSMLFPRESSLPCLWKEDTDGEVIEANVPNTQSSNEPAAWTLQGGFLAKSEGTWYVLTESDRLQAIPDDQSTRVVSGEFSVRYSRIGSEGLPVGESVAEEDMESNVAYVAVKNCSSFPSQPVLYKFKFVN